MTKNTDERYAMRILELKNLEESAEAVGGTPYGYLQQSIVGILKSFTEPLKITEAEKRFHKRWQELGRLVFESYIQDRDRCL